MRTDSIVLAEAAQDALERFREITGCLEYGDGWSCRQPATPDGPPRLLAHDERGNDTWMRLYRCVARHSYHVETLAPHAPGAEDADILAILRLPASAS